VNSAEYLEFFACLKGRWWAGAPDCSCPVLCGFARLYDRTLQEHNEPPVVSLFAVRLNAARWDANTQRRAYRLADWACREIAPLALPPAYARTLRALPEIVDEVSALCAMHEASAAGWAGVKADGSHHIAAFTASLTAKGAAEAAIALTSDGKRKGSAHTGTGAVLTSALAADRADRHAILTELPLTILDELCPRL
jgi:hypothetical protein